MTRDEVVAEAVTWIGTPYHPMACIKGVGADCALFPFAVYQAVGGIPTEVAPPVYTSSWMLHRDEEEFGNDHAASSVSRRAIAAISAPRS